MSDGQITRKDIITDDALNWGPDYAKGMEAAIGKNKEFATSILAMNEANKLLRGSANQKEFAENTKKLNEESQKTIGIWKEQIQLENALISTKKKNALATEGTNKALVKERLELVLVNKQVKQETLERLGLVSAYDKLNKSRTDAKNKLRDLIASEKATTAEIKKATVEFERFDLKVKKADQAVGDFSKNVGNYKSAFSGLGNLFAAFGIAGGIAGIIATTKEIYNTTKELQSLDLALKSVTGTNENFAKQQIFLSTIAEKYGLEIKNLTKQYTAFYVAAKDKLAAGEIQDLFENIAKSGAALGLSNETLERSFTALNQMLSKGTVASEELRGQLAEALPGSVQAMVKAVQILHPEIKNLTEKGLFEMIKAGKILASEVLPETARQLVLVTGADKAEGIDTITKSTNRLTDAWIKLVRATAQSKIGSFIDEGISDFFNTISGTLEKITLQVKGFNSALKDAALVGQGLGEKNFRTDFRTASDDPKNRAKTQEQIRAALREGYIWEFNAAKDNLERLEKLRQNADIANRTQREMDVLEAKKTFQEAATKIRLSRIQVEKETSLTNDELSDAEKKKQEKRDKDRLDAARRLSDSLYELQKQRLEQSIKFNNDIASDEEQNDDVRIAASLRSQKKQIELTNLTKKHSLDADKFVLDKDKLNSNDKIRIKEDAANKIVDIEKKTSEEIEKIRVFDEAKYQKSLDDKISKLNVVQNTELESENRRFQELGDLEAMAQKDREKAIEDHERKIFDIKKQYAIKALKLQISNLETELAASDLLPINEQLSADKRQKIAEALSKAKLDLSEVEISDNSNKNKKTVEEEKSSAEKILQISQDLTGALSDLANAVFATKIQNIEYEIDKNNEYYDKQIELAGNDERQKDLLQKERDKKNDELEKRKRKEQHKQAVFEKEVTVAQIGLQTALAIIKAAATTAPTFWAVAIAAGIGAIQLGTALATPIPKYKDGRKGGPAEDAWVGDGYINEVITKADGSNPILTPNVPTLTRLGKGDIVHKSVADYNDYMRTAILNGFKLDNQRITEFQTTQFENNNKELVEEMKLTRKAIEKNKTNVTVNVPKVDIPHELWKAKNTNWNQ